MTLEKLLNDLENSPMERLRWKVLCRFGVLPTSRQRRRLKDRDCIICGAHMVLDARERSGGREVEAAVNAAFDRGRFEELAGGKNEKETDRGII